MIKNTLVAVLAVFVAFVTYGLVAGHRELARRRRRDSLAIKRAWN